MGIRGTFKDYAEAKRAAEHIWASGRPEVTQTSLYRTAGREAGKYGADLEVHGLPYPDVRALLAGFDVERLR